MVAVMKHHILSLLTHSRYPSPRIHQPTPWAERVNGEMGLIFECEAFGPFDFKRDMPTMATWRSLDLFGWMRP